MHYKPTKKTMATIKQQTAHPTMQALQTKLQNSIHRHQLIKKQQKKQTLQALQTNLRQIHPDNH